MANLSILGLYNYDQSIFDNLEIPEGLDRDVLISSILAECSDFSLLYPDFNFMKMAIGVWSTNEQKIWEAMETSVDQEYNPIENYDRHEEIERNVIGDHSNSVTDTGGNTNYNTSFDSNEQRQTDKNEMTSTRVDTGEGNTNEQVTSHVHGNVGVTTAGQMLRDFREISNFSVIDFIVHSFANRFCIQVY